ncbi:4250_t:CDS:2, partial [Acaulospora colombiana]
AAKGCDNDNLSWLAIQMYGISSASSGNKGKVVDEDVKADSPG